MTAQPVNAQQKRMLFRTDASATAGTGHLMRCLALGVALRQRGASVSFACAPLPPVMADLVRSRGFELRELVPSATQDSDAQATRAAAGADPWDWLVVDHYGLDATWESRMRGACRRLLAVDDLANRPHDCDALLDQNLREDGGSAYDGNVPVGCERLLGPRFALLDPAFPAARADLGARERDGILVSFGGSDAHALTLPVLQALIALTRGAVRIDVVAGALNRDAESIRIAAADASNVSFHHAPRDVAGLMARAAVYAGAGGSTSWERCCLGLPGVVVAVASNQEAACLALDSAGCHVFLGNTPHVSPEAIATAAIALFASSSWKARLAERCAALVDGQGAARIAARLVAGDVRLRPASQSDERALLDWRNHPEVRRHSGDPAKIDRDEHGHWLARTLADPKRQLLIGEDDGGPLGVLRYDIADGSATVSVYLAPHRLSQGAGAGLLAAGERWIATEHPELRELRAQVRSANHASERLFANAGYRSFRSDVSKVLATKGVK